MAKKSPKPLQTISDLTPDPKNPNKGTTRGREVLQRSIERLGMGRSVLADVNGKMIAGNKTVEAAIAAGVTKIKVVAIEKDELLVAQRADLNLDTDKEAREMSVVDNRAQEVSLEWDTNVMGELVNDGIDLTELGFSGPEAIGVSEGVLEGPDGGEVVQSDAEYEIVPRAGEEYDYVVIFTKTTLERAALHTMLKIKPMEERNGGKHTRIGTGRVLPFDAFKKQWESR